MPVDWISYSYAAIVTVGGILGYARKGSVMSLMSGLLFGSLAGYGAYQVSNDPQNVKISLLTAGILTTVMECAIKGLERSCLLVSLLVSAFLWFYDWYL